MFSANLNQRTAPPVRSWPLPRLGWLGTQTAAELHSAGHIGELSLSGSCRNFWPDYYCLITVPSRFRISPHPPFRSSGPEINGDLAAAFSSISIPHPGFSLTHRYPSFISGQPWKISWVRSLKGEYS